MRAVLPTLGLYVSVAWGQSSTQRVPAVPPVYGAVAGRITCVDTNGPARLTEVTLQTINVKPEPAEKTKDEPSAPLQTYQTLLDGTFIIPKVQVGTYYVVINKAGYLSPITQFTQAELANPTQEMLARIIKVVPTVTVESSHTSNLEVRLERGAVLAGAIHYDDGSPVATVSVRALGREKKGAKWTQQYPPVLTDDQGRYRMTSLAPGEYLLQTGLALEEKFVSSVLGGSGASSSTNTKYSLDFYFGDTARESEGKPIKLNAGEEHDGADIMIPVSKLHSVAGTITEVRSGHTINAGKLEISYADGKQLASAKVAEDDGFFQFDFVPEGEYTLSVTEAKDVLRQTIVRPFGWFPPSEIKETVIKEYAGSSQPLVVKNDLTGVIVSVPGKSTK